MKKKVICGVAARSGGHIIPCLTLIEKSKQDHPETTVLFFTSHSDIDTTIGKQFSWITHKITLSLGNIPYRRPWLFIPFFFNLTISFLKSFYYLIKHRPLKVISTGGYLSIPVCIAAKFLLIPIELFELNVIPGKATRFLSPLATELLICFPMTKKYFSHSCRLVPYPLRFKTEDKNLHQTLPFTVDQKKKIIFILGGSQGSDFLNTYIVNALKKSKEKNIQIIHQTGHTRVNGIKKIYSQLGISAHVFAYEHNLVPYYQNSDVVLCRAGAGTLFETAFFEKKCLTIPLEISTNSHQVDNAYAMKQFYPKLFKVFRQKDLDALESTFITVLLCQPEWPTD